MKSKFILLSLLAIAFALRIFDLADRNIWWDEGLAAWAARLPTERIVDWTAHDVHPPLYFWLLSLWWRVVGDGEFVLRFPSALTGVVGVAVMYGFARALAGRAVGLLAAAALTASVFAISWSQEMRMYIWAATLTTGVMWAAYRLWQSEKRVFWWAYVLACAAALWTLYLNASVIVIVNLGFVVAWWWQKRPAALLWRWASAQIVALALIAPWLIYALPRIPNWSTAEPFTPSFFVQLYSTMLAVGIPVNLEDYAPFTLTLMAVWLPGLVFLWRQVASPTQRAAQWMLLLGVIMPALVVYAVSLPFNPFYYAPRLAPRYLLPLAPCFYVLLAWGVNSLPRKLNLFGAALALGVAVSGWWPFFANRLRQDDLISLTDTIRAYARPQDSVVLHSDRDWPLFAAQYTGEWRGVPYGAAVSAEGVNNLITPLWEEGEGIWLVSTPDSLRIDPQSEIQKWLHARAVAQVSWSLGDTALAFYARTSGRAASLHTLNSEFTPPNNISNNWLLGSRVPVPRYRPGENLHLALYWLQLIPEKISIELIGQNGSATLALQSPVPTPAESGLTRQIASYVVPPDLPMGKYNIYMTPFGRTEIGAIEVLPSLVANTATLADIGTPLTMRFGDSIRLLGYTLTSTQAQPGGTLTLTLYWQASAPITERYKVTVQLQGEEFNAASNNFLWGQQDNEPVNGFLPTTSWPTKTIIADAYALPISANAPPGLYTLQVGLYGLLDGARLEVFNADSDSMGDAARLTEIQVR